VNFNPIIMKVIALFVLFALVYTVSAGNPFNPNFSGYRWDVDTYAAYGTFDNYVSGQFALQQAVFMAVNVSSENMVFDFGLAGTYYMKPIGTYTFVVDTNGNGLCFLRNVSFQDQVDAYAEALQYTVGVFPGKGHNNIYSGLVSDVHDCGAGISSTIHTSKKSYKILNWYFSQWAFIAPFGVLKVAGNILIDEHDDNIPSDAFDLPPECAYPLDYCEYLGVNPGCDSGLSMRDTQTPPVMLRYWEVIAENLGY